MIAPVTVDLAGLDAAQSLGLILTSAAEVDSFILRVDAAATSLFGDIANAPLEVADLSMRSGYTSWYVGWRAFVVESAPGVLDKIPPLLLPLPRLPRQLASIYEETARRQVELEAWIERFTAAGGVYSGAPLAPPPEPSTSDLQGTVKVVAIGAAVVVGGIALVYALSMVPRRSNPGRRRRAA